MFIKNPQLVTPEGITFNVPTVAKTAAEIAADAKAAAKAAQAIAQGTTATIPTGDAGNLLKQDGQNVKGGGDTNVAKYSFKNGKYEDASYHSAKGDSVKSAKPLDGQHALDNSIKIKDASPSRIAISNDQFVVLMETSPGLYHGHVRQWKELNIYMQNVLKEAGLVRPNGKIIR